MSLLRLSPQVQRIQAVAQEKTGPRRWENLGDWGARHIHDKAPFSLWDNEKRQYRLPSRGDEYQWIQSNYEKGSCGISGWFMWIETSIPPQPVPLTVGCMPVIFVDIRDMDIFKDMGRGMLYNPDAFPAKETNIALLTALQPLANVCAVTYLPNWTVIELKFGDGREYGRMSLPGVVAGRTTLYHHAETPFFDSMKDMIHANRMDPAKYPPFDKPMPQDTENYLQHSTKLSPGCRIECGSGKTGSRLKGMNSATSAGVKLRGPGGKEALTVAHNGFLASQDVYHPFACANEEKIGRVIDTRPELDVALVELTPLASLRFTNNSYFQAEKPRKLLKASELVQGSFSEVDGMSSGLVALFTLGLHYERPELPEKNDEHLAKHEDISFSDWKAYQVHQIFGAVNSNICDGMCGAPIVDCATGGVSGFFQRSNGQVCFSACLDDLIDEGWQLAEPQSWLRIRTFAVKLLAFFERILNRILPREKGESEEVLVV